MKKLKPRDVRRIYWVIMIVGVIVALFGLPNENKALLIIGALIMIASIIFYYIFYRCPSCGRYLDRSTGQYCPYCGVNIDKK